MKKFFCLYGGPTITGLVLGGLGAIKGLSLGLAVCLGIALGAIAIVPFWLIYYNFFVPTSANELPPFQGGL